MRLVLLIIFSAIFSPCNAQNRPLENFKKNLTKDKIVLPITYRSGANPMVEVMVNGKGPYKFMIETGGGGLGSRLDIRVFNELKPRVVDSVMAGDGSGVNRKAYPIVRLDKIDLGGYEITDASAMVRNYNDRPGFDKMDGAISLSYFSGALLELNFEKNELVITKGSLDANDKNTIPINFDSGIPVITIELNGKKIQANFDTGNMGGLTFHQSDIPAEIIDGEVSVVGQAKTVSNTFEIKEAKLNVPVKIGSLSFDKQTVNINDMLRKSNVGVKFAKQLNITFDVANKLMKLERFNKVTTATQSTPSKKLSEFTGQYEEGRAIILGDDGFLYIQRPGGQSLKMTSKKSDEFGLETVPTAAFIFVRDRNGKVVSMKVSRDGGATWTEAKKL